jgi:DNA-binding beta-propeller fold protein YncE
MENFTEAKMRKAGSYLGRVGILVALAIAYGAFCPAQAQQIRYEVDPTWPKPLPNRWITGRAGGICVDAQDHIFEVNRKDLQEKEAQTGQSAPSVLEYDSDGNLVNSFGDPKGAPPVPESIHGCFVDKENNLWVAGNEDAVVQKWTHDGASLLMQIGTRGVFDSSNGTIRGIALNQSKTLLNKPAGVAIDPTNGDVYIADGYGDHRIVVFDKTGKFLRQWGHQAYSEESAAGAPAAFMGVVHCVAIDNNGLVYVCDRQGNRIQVFDKMGNFKKNIAVSSGTEKTPDDWGTAWWLAFSRDPAQKYMIVADGRNELVHILDHESGKELAKFGRPGHQLGEFTHCHTLDVDSKGNIYIAETDWGRRVQKFKLVASR